MKIYKNIYIEINRNLKHWGKNIEFIKSDEVIPYFRFYCFFIYFGKPIQSCN